MGTLLTPSAADNVFDTNASTRDVYDEFAKPIIQSAMDGVNGTIFAYGMTSSGKTYTIYGSESGDAGIISLAIQNIFRIIEKVRVQTLDPHVHV